MTTPTPRRVRPALRSFLYSILTRDSRLVAHWTKLKVMRLMMPAAFNEIIDAFCWYSGPARFTQFPMPGNRWITAGELLHHLEANEAEIKAINNVVMAVWMRWVDDEAERGRGRLARTLNALRSRIPGSWEDQGAPQARVMVPTQGNEAS